MVEYFESQSRRKNLIFHGFIEDVSDLTWDACEKRVLRYLHENLSMSTNGIEIERPHRLGRVGNQRPIIAKSFNFKDKEKIKSKIRQLQSDDDNWVNPHRVADDFAPGIRQDRKELYKYMKVVKGEEGSAYLSLNKLDTLYLIE